MQIGGQHPLGCSVRLVFGVYSYNYYHSSDVQWNDAKDVRTKAGLKALLRDLNKIETGGVCIWVDTDDEEEDRGFSGKKFYESLKGRGYDVQKSRRYQNPNHEGKCTVYLWYFRTPPNSRSARPAANVRRKKVVKKAKAA